MKLARCVFQNRVWWAAVEDDQVRLLADADAALHQWNRGALQALASVTIGRAELSDVVLLNPVPAPTKVVCVGLNYRDHALEAGMDLPKQPMLFAKFPASLTGPGSPIVIPAASDKIDWEVELTIVISDHTRNIPVERALDAIAGYTIANDVSARDLQMADGQFVRAKSYDTFCPVGPWVVTQDELGAAADLGIGLTVNGETLQDSTTAQLVFDVREIVAYCSSVTTLNPGDIILTGTPSGVGLGLKPPRYLQAGDVVSAWVEGIGSLTNPVVAAS